MIVYVRTSNHDSMYNAHPNAVIIMLCSSVREKLIAADFAEVVQLLQVHYHQIYILLLSFIVSILIHSTIHLQTFINC